jgi:signal transduction histidine kinase
MVSNLSVRKTTKPLSTLLARSAFQLLLWVSGTLALIITIIVAGVIALAQGIDQNRLVLENLASDLDEIQTIAKDASPQQLDVLRKFLVTDSQSAGTLELSENLSLEYKGTWIDGLQTAHWIEGGKRYDGSKREIGDIPSHWRAALLGLSTTVMQEPADSPILTGRAKLFGATTAILPLRPGVAVVYVNPGKVVSSTELFFYSLFWGLVLWLVLMAIFFLCALPVLFWYAKRQAKAIAMPLEKLSESASAVASGKLDAKLEVALDPKGSAEAFSMTQSFNAMLEALTNARGAQAQAIAQQKQFVADISHDLRTPLTAIMGYTERAMRTHPNDQDLRVIEREANALAGLTHNLFELAQADAGESRLHLTKFPIHTLLDELAASFKPGAWQKGVLVRVAAADQPLMIVADRQRLEIALKNLLSNAIRHTQQGGLIELAAVESGSQLTISVKDTGDGIAEDVLPHIFKRGFRSDGARTERGGGLGLSIVQQIVQAHGGEVRVSSVLGEGSRFEILLSVSVA